MKTTLIAATLMLSLASTGVAYAKPSCATLLTWLSPQI
jgi:hypothetical protein